MSDHAIPAIVVLGPSGMETAARVRAALGPSEVHARGGVEGADVTFDGVAGHLQSLFAAGRPIVGICASGILIRALGSSLSEKTSEPPVIAVPETGSAVVPLLGGHRGANDMAIRIAGALGVAAAITTAGDVRFGVALDAPPEGWVLANPEHIKSVMARLLAGAHARIEGDAAWLSDSDLPLGADGDIALVATARTDTGGPDRLVYHPHSLVIGVGCERGCDPQELIALAERTLEDAGLSPHAVGAVVSLDLKADEDAVHAVAAHLAVPARFFDAATLNAEAPRLATPSDLVLREVGCPGVAEGAALAAAGADGTLVVVKQKSDRATCAIAETPQPLSPENIGRGRGKLAIVGIGPGGPDWRSAEATRDLRAATDWVGYGLYLDLIADLKSRQTEHRFDLGAEEARVAHALKLAGEGRDVALVCSGDAGIYAMATLVFELLDQPDVAARAGSGAARAEIKVVPGISALQMAAARVGAPLGHDFCAISLSDLLTPWAAIVTRLKAAAEGDFVVALYNPRSKKRRDQLDTAIAILRGARPPSTPVVIASNLGRPAERIAVTTLADFDPETVDMLTTVLVGASQSSTLRMGDGSTRVYTPRGYAAKREAS